MANFSNYFENQIINHMLRNQAFTPPTELWCALFTASTGLESNAPTAEVSGGGYARQSFTLTIATEGTSENTTDILFDEATESWGTISHLAIVDHPTNTQWGTNVNVLMWGTLVTPKTVNSGDTFKISAGDLDISVL